MTPEEELLDGARRGDLKKVRSLLDLGIKIQCPPQALFDMSLADGDISNVLLLLRAKKDFEWYEKTGEVGENLLPFFDQNGLWYGVGHQKKTFGKLGQERIPIEKTMRTDSSGKVHLLTSFIGPNKEPLHLPYTSVSGDIRGGSSLSFDAPNLEEVGGDIDINNCDQCSAPKLKTILGFLLAINVKKIDIDSLAYVGCSLDITGMKSIELPSLEYVGGYFGGEEATSIYLPKLTSVGNGFLATVAKVFKAPILQEIKGDFVLPAFNSLKTQQLKNILSSTQSKITTESLKMELAKRRAIDKTLEVANENSLIL